MKTKSKSLSAQLILIAMILLMLVIGGLFAFWAFGSTITPEDKVVTKTFALGESTIKGFVGVELSSDIKPEAIRLISADNDMYDVNTADEYIEYSTGAITLLIDTDQLCKWKLELSISPDAKFEYKFVNKPSQTLYIDNPRVVKSGRYYYVQLNTIVNDPSETKGMCSLSLKNKKGDTYNLITSEIPLNEQAYVRFEPPIDAFTNEEYTVSVVVETEKQIAKDAFTLKLTSSLSSSTSSPVTEIVSESTTETTSIPENAPESVTTGTTN